MNRCPYCGEWVDTPLLFCPDCRTPIAPLEPQSRRPMPLMAFVIVLSALVVLAVLLGRWLTH